MLLAGSPLARGHRGSTSINFTPHSLKESTAFAKQHDRAARSTSKPNVLAPIRAMCALSLALQNKSFWNVEKSPLSKRRAGHFPQVYPDATSQTSSDLCRFLAMLRVPYLPSLAANLQSQVARVTMVLHVFS